MPPGGPRGPNFQCGPGKTGPVRLWSGDWQCVTPCSQIRKNTLRKAKDLVDRCEEEGEKKISRLRGKRRPWRLDPNRKGPKSKRPNGNDSSSDDDDWPPYRPKTKAEAQTMRQEWRGRRGERQAVARNGQPAMRDNVSYAQEIAQQVQGIEDAERREREQADREALAVPDEEEEDEEEEDEEEEDDDAPPVADAPPRRPKGKEPAEDEEDDDDDAPPVDADPGTGKWEDRVEGRVYVLNNADLKVKPNADKNDPYTIAQAQEEIVKQLPWAEKQGDNQIKCKVCGWDTNVSVDVNKGNKNGKPTWSNLNKHVNNDKHKEGLKASSLTLAQAKTVFSGGKKKVRGKKRATD